MGKGFEAYVSHYLYQLAKCYWDGNFLKAFFFLLKEYVDKEKREEDSV